MAIKVSTGKLILPLPIENFVAEHTERNNIELLPIEVAHLALVPLHGRRDRLIIACSTSKNVDKWTCLFYRDGPLVSRLPFHHRDPFDRLIIAQSLTENMAVVSADRAFDAYGVTRLW